VGLKILEKAAAWKKNLASASENTAGAEEDGESALGKRSIDEMTRGEGEDSD
jgi:hypothetical protein